METELKKYWSLAALAENTGLTKKYLRELAEQKIIPSLNVRGRLRFNPVAVQKALDRMASKKAKATILQGDHHDS